VKKRLEKDLRGLFLPSSIQSYFLDKKSREVIKWKVSKHKFFLEH